MLAALAEEDRVRVLAATRRHKYGRGEVLFHEGDPGDTLHLIDGGHVAIRMTTENGDVATLAVLGPGECFGEQALLSSAARRLGTAVAVERAETLALSRDEFVRLRDERPSIDGFLVEALAAQVRQLTAHLLEARYTPGDTRIMRHLASLAQLYRSDGNAVIPVTQEDIATMAGVTRPTVNRVLQCLAGEGVVAISRGRIEVLQLDVLESRAH